MEKTKGRQWKKIALISVVVVAAIAYGFFHSNADDDVQMSEGADATAVEGEMSSSEEGGQESPGMESQKSEEDEEDDMIFVDVGGAVRHPQVVCIEKGSRIYEAVEAAGGASEDAETKYLNMASQCEDGQKIYIPTQAETEAVQSGDPSAESSAGLFTADPQILQPEGGAAAGTSETADTKININTATSEELQTLNGIGPSMAERIIEYRQTNGNFSSIDDLTNVSGIGEKTLAKFSADICV